MTSAGKEDVYVLYHGGLTLVMGVFSTEATAKAVFLAGKAQHPDEDFKPECCGVFVYRAPLDELFSIGFPCNNDRIVSRDWIDEIKAK